MNETTTKTTAAAYAEQIDYYNALADQADALGWPTMAASHRAEAQRLFVASLTA